MFMQTEHFKNSLLKVEREKYWMTSSQMHQQQQTVVVIISTFLLITVFLTRNTAVVESFAFHPYSPRNLSFYRINDGSGISKVATSLSMILSADDLDGDISRQLAKAKDLLKQVKAKLENSDGETTVKKKKEAVDTKDKRSRVIKTEDPDSGLITTNGELMAELSKDEEWEARTNLFDEDSAGAASARTLKKREMEVAQAIFNLKKELRDEDYKRVFDKKNYFIGEDN